MDEVYAISDKPQGPWLFPESSAQAALDRGRANFDWPIVWVAKMREPEPDDLISTEMLLGEIMERITTKFGVPVAGIFEETIDVQQMLLGMRIAMRQELYGHIIPMIKRPYNRDQNARPNDFKPTIEELEG